MKTIGLIGGLSWESTLLYYQLINREVQQRLGEAHSAKCLINSVDLQPIVNKQIKGDWDGLAKDMIEAAITLQQAGADFILLCTNTMHKLAPQIEGSLSIPFIHIVDAVGQKIQDNGYTKVGMLATKYSMEEDFLKCRYKEKFGIEVIVPKESSRNEVHHVIYNELIQGQFTSASKKRYLEIMEELMVQGAQGIITGCTEIELLVRQDDTKIPLFASSHLHALKAVDLALKT